MERGKSARRHWNDPTSSDDAVVPCRATLEYEESRRGKSWTFACQVFPSFEGWRLWARRMSAYFLRPLAHRNVTKIQTDCLSIMIVMSDKLPLLNAVENHHTIKRYRKNISIGCQRAVFQATHVFSHRKNERRYAVEIKSNNHTFRW